jgi:5-methylcytosine-specific restriction endonuclease McrA
MLGSGASITEVAETLALAKSTVCYHARSLGYRAEAKYAKRYDWQAIRRYYDEGHSAAECRKLGFTSSSWCDAIERGDIVPRSRGMDVHVYLARQDNCRPVLRKRLLMEGLKRNECERCGVSRWRGKPLSLQLHHINGDGHDNRLENLQLLCPNCHSQTENYGGAEPPPSDAGGEPRGLGFGGPSPHGTLSRRPRPGPKASPGPSPRPPARPGPGARPRR